MGSLSAPRKMQTKKASFFPSISHRLGAIPPGAFQHFLLNIEGIPAFSPHRQVNPPVPAARLPRTYVFNFHHNSFHLRIPGGVIAADFLISSPIWIDMHIKSVKF